MDSKFTQNGLLSALSLIVYGSKSLSQDSDINLPEICQQLLPMATTIVFARERHFPDLSIE